MRYKWVPVIDSNVCTGCQECVYACGPNCLEVFEGTVILSKSDRCGSEEHCIAPCPVGGIEMQWVEMICDESVGRWKN